MHQDAAIGPIMTPGAIDELVRTQQIEWFIENVFNVFKTLPPDEISRDSFENFPRNKQIKTLRKIIKHLRASKNPDEVRIREIAQLTWQTLRGSAPSWSS